MQHPFSKLKLKSRASNIPDADPAVTSGKPPSTKQIYQSRLNYGVNFGSSFVLEKWIFGDLFGETKGDSELDAVSSLVDKHGVDDTRAKFENHWNSYVTDDDWKWLADHQVNSIRLPIGYWDVDGGNFTSGFKFEKYKAVYANAWSIIKKKYIEPALKHQISVLVDIHGLPGGANDSGHSGESGCNGGFWKDDKAQLEMAKLSGWVANDLKNYENIAGIQVVNEANFADPPKKQTTYYAAAITEIRKSDKSVPVVISDGWWPDQWVKWVQQEQGDDGYIGVVVDEHVYRCFSDSDKKKSAEQIIDDLNGDVLTNLNDNGKGVDFIVGEWSCVLDQQTWDHTKGNRDDLVVKYGQHELQAIEKRASGSYFWTFKFQSGNGGEWDFKTMTDKGALKPFPKPSNPPSDDQFKQAVDNATNNHANYWKDQDPKGKYEPDLFKDGFSTAWKDADSFAKFNASRIGRKEALKRSRLLEALANKKGSQKNIWEWEQGYDEGLKEFYNATIH
ncbi:Cellulase (glycosyl hydrolase 5) family protein [Candida parapsilosis]|uniref:Cellulase (Glycosyl hydrolase 5) family protein n=1 Tax=Candida parapsilosis TaxID=5480 RepID=A0A8X7T898_CANPA|nr:Cellulase (glycosyl hydrolase 5) family protein [Candida parapsilosis]KAF6041964.1 Cellulase (glycosyl hydrolase 5) family protein [Candida parapsilosis]KAF6042675.1 Cellulase (glycosyl hydrolase 5) family protein [Candida parapsilosis]KAF6058299.1 Cellulase (glycosyl hydrolase 5) family protein [Candida parapsilosis]KAI5901257.1 putative glycosyl hydrolase [Candida parapsilosis]